MTTTSGPGVALKSETIGLAVSLELPLIIVRRPARRAVDRAADQDRAGRPAAGDVRPQRRGAGRRSSRRARRPTASTPALEAVRIATTYRTPVFLLSDGYLANGSEPWRIPDVDDLPDLRVDVRDRDRTHVTEDGSDGVLAVPARPGDAGPAVGHARHAGPRAPDRRHREGRRLRQHLLRPGQPRPHGPHLRQAKIDGIAATSPLEVDDPTGDAEVLVLGWGSTYGPIGAAAVRVRARRRPRSPRRTCAT